MLGYIDTIKNFTNTDEREIISYLKNIYSDASVSQIRSWEVLVNELKNSTIVPKIHPDTIIGIEYSLTVENMSIDVFLVGRNGYKNIIYVIESKQWNDYYISSNKFSNYREDANLLHPQVQVYRHVMAIKDYLSVGELIDSFKPYVYIKNATVQGCKKIIDTNNDNASINIPVINDLNSLLENIHKVFITPPTLTVDDFKNAKYYPSKNIIKAMKSIVTKETPFILTNEQEKVLINVLEAIKNGKKIIRITGAAGSGKTAILLNIYVRMLQKKSSFIPYFVSGAQNTALYRGLYSEVAGCFNYTFNLKHSILKSRINNPVILIDEAQHNQPGILTELLNLGATLILCYDEWQTINANNSLDELKNFENRSDFMAISLESSIRFNGSMVFEKNIKQLLLGNTNFESDDKYDFKICNTLDEVLNKTSDIIQNNPDNTAAVIGLLSDDAEDIVNKSNGKLFTNWTYKKEIDWIRYVQRKDYLSCNNEAIWVGTWWLPGLDVDYVTVIVGNDVRLTKEGIVGDPYQSKNYNMIISVAEKLNFPKYLTAYNSNVKKVESILNYIDLPGNLQKRQQFISLFSIYLRNMYYVMMTRGQKGCYIYFKNNELLNEF